MNTEPNGDANAIADNIERTVRSAALRKVRKLADQLEADEAAKRRLEKRALIITVVVATVLTVWFVSGLIASDDKFERGKTIQMPDKVIVPPKN